MEALTGVGVARIPTPEQEDDRRLHGLHPRGALDFLDALVALQVLERDDWKYHNAPDTALFLDRNRPGYVGGLLEMANAPLYSFVVIRRKQISGNCPAPPRRRSALSGNQLRADAYAEPHVHHEGPNMEERQRHQEPFLPYVQPQTAHYLLDNGHPFLMEKPMGLNAEEVAGIAAKTDATGGFAAVPLPLRYSPFVS